MRTAIYLRVSAVARRNRVAMAISPGAFWRARTSSSSVQPHRLNSPARIPIGMNQKAGFLPRLGQSLKKTLAIHVVEEDFFEAIATSQDAVNCPVIFIAQWAWHGAIVTILVANVKQIFSLYFGPTLFFLFQSAVRQRHPASGCVKEQLWLDCLNHRTPMDHLNSPGDDRPGRNS